VVPPPKHGVRSLVDCEFAASVQVEELFVLARGPRADEELGTEEAVDILLENTEDAYQFPPSGHIFPALVFGGEDYDALRRRERALVAEAVSGLRARRLTRDDFTWADDLPVMAGRS
ncbi:MAG: hypothetical protein ACRD0M_13550, partial [Acidimicrobiales bacterium]